MARRGRPKAGDGEKKDVSLTVKAKPAQAQLIRAWAKSRGVGVSAFMRRAAEHYINMLEREDA